MCCITGNDNIDETQNNICESSSGIFVLLSIKVCQLSELIVLRNSGK